MRDNTDISSQLTADNFQFFVFREEEKRGYLLSFKGESNTTLWTFVKGFFRLIFTQRYILARQYGEDAILRITENYKQRIKSEEVPNFPKESVESCIKMLRNFIATKNSKFWSGNSVNSITRVRALQRAECYLNALSLI